MTSPPPNQKQKFYHFPSHLEDSRGTHLFQFLRENVTWEQGVRSRRGETRLAKSLNFIEFLMLLDDFPGELAQINELIENYSIKKGCAGVYINYYRNGVDWTPNHTHPGTTQMVVSLGATRTFTYGKNHIASKNGDIFLFGSSVHGVPKEPNIAEERISIAFFLI